MNDRHDAVYVAAGGLGALLLGLALAPLRDAVSASSLAFPFLLLTIVMSEYGGRRTAVTTALVSAASLDFFLTKPYLRLTISEKDDLVAFLGLAACGLVAAWFGSRRSASAERAESLQRQLDLLREAQRHLTERGPAEPVVASILASVVTGLPLAAAVVTDARGIVIASAGRHAPASAPRRILSSDPASLGLPISADGASIELTSVRGREGWLDVWGAGTAASAGARRSLADVGGILGALLERRG